MKLKTLVHQMRVEYYELFPSDFHALVHLYVVNGNGFEWFKGQLVDVCDSKPAPRTKAPEISFDPSIYLEDYLRYMEIDSRMGLFYPLCKYANIVSIPDNVQTDYLSAAKYVADTMLKYMPQQRYQIAEQTKWVKIAQKRIKELLKTT